MLFITDGLFHWISRYLSIRFTWESNYQTQSCKFWFFVLCVELRRLQRLDNCAHQHWILQHEDQMKKIAACKKIISAVNWLTVANWDERQQVTLDYFCIYNSKHSVFRYISLLLSAAQKALNWITWERKKGRPASLRLPKPHDIFRSFWIGVLRL